MKSVLVVFGKDLPKKNKKWLEGFDKVLTGKELEEFIGPGSVQEAFELVNRISKLTLPDGSRLSKLINYRGYELWWMHYDDIYEFSCLPYTRYANLLFYLKNFENVYLFRPPHSDLFRYFLKAHSRQCIILDNFKFRKLLPIPLGIFIQFSLSLWFLLWLKITRPKLMVWASDKFAPPHDYDFRMKFIYEELRRKKISFIEFIRSMEPWHVVLRHAWRRKRPVVYSAAIIELLHSFTRPFSHHSFSFSETDPEKRFQFFLATQYLHNLRGATLSIRAMEFILRWIGVRGAIIPGGSNRTLHENLGCKLAGIKTVGIQHAAIAKYVLVSDFMPEFDGSLSLSVDRFGLWSSWWKEYYLKNSRVIKPEQLYVSGPMRPLMKDAGHPEACPASIGPLKVLFISEQLADPREIMPYLAELLAVKDFALFMKFRPYRDGFEEWLKENQPDVYKKISEQTKILRGPMGEAISQCDVAVGSHSTAVLEALMQSKPMIFFWTNKWGDYFDIKPLDADGWFFADTPKELVDYIKKSNGMPKELLEQLQERFFGDPYQNGSKWVVEQALEFVENYGK